MSFILMTTRRIDADHYWSVKGDVMLIKRCDCGMWLEMTKSMGLMCMLKQKQAY